MDKLIHQQNETIRTEERDLLVRIKGYLMQKGESLFIEEINRCLQKPLEEPDMRHRKIQSLLSEKARKSIELSIIENIIFDDEHEYDCGMDADYTTPLTDRIYKKIQYYREKIVEKENIVHYAIPNRYGQIILMSAEDLEESLRFNSAKGNLEDVKHILKHKMFGFNIDAVKEYGYSAFLSAVKNGHILVVDELLANGAELYQKGKGDHALTLAVINNQVEMVEHLLSLGFDINKTNHYGSTALTNAVKVGEKMIFLLLEKGADLSAGNTNFIDYLNKQTKMRYKKQELIDKVKAFVDNRTLKSLIHQSEYETGQFNF